MCSECVTSGRDLPVMPRIELLHESERTRVTRLMFPGESVVRKEFLGPLAERRSRHEMEILERLSGIEGIVQLADRRAPICPGVLLMADVGGTALYSRTVSYDPADLIDFAEMLARAVAGMHRQGVVHRDINPANIVVSPTQPGVFLIDFALATTTAINPKYLHQHEIVGTVPYLAPEQTGRTGRPVDQRADLYAVGATLYELATGAPPFGTGDPLRVIHDHLGRVPVPPSAVNSAVPTGLSAVIMHLLEKEPDDRYQTADGLLFDLALVRRGAGVVHLGDHDFPVGPLMPSRLAGRAGEIGELRRVFAQAVAGRCPGVLLAGVPGVGKTSLANELRPVVAEAGGWFVTGKFDQYRQDWEYNGVLQAFRALGRLLLAEPEANLVEMRDRILRVLGPNAGLAAATVPELATLLKVNPEQGDPMTLQVRGQQNAVEVLRAVASRERPLVFFVDDLQWAWRAPLRIIDPILGGEENVEGLLLVGALRDNEVDAAHPLTSMLARWSLQPAGPHILRLGNLAPEGQAEMVADLLKLAPAPAGELARMIAPSTAGNPHTTAELLNSLRQDGVLARGDSGLRWDEAGLHRRLHVMNAAGLLTAQVTSLPPETRESLAMMTCLAGRAELDLLKAATGLAADELERRLAPAFAAGLLVLESGGQPAVRFDHDQTRESILEGLTAEARRAVRLSLARRLADRNEFLTVAAEQYLLVADSVDTPQEQRQMVNLFLRAAEETKLLISSPLAERFLTAVVRFIDPTNTDQLLAVHLDRHAALYRQGRLDEADEAYQTICRLCTDPVQCAEATAVQVSSLTGRGRAAEALRLGLDALRSLGHHVPDGDRMEMEIDRGLDALYQWIDQTGEADDLRRPKITDRSRLGVMQLIKRLMVPAYECDPAILAWLSVTTLQMWVRDGPHPALLGPSGYIGFVTVSRRRDYRTGHRMTRRILAVGQARGYRPDLWLAQFLYVAGTGHWFEPLEDNLSAARRALDGLTQSGDLQNAGYTHCIVIQNLLDCAPSLDLLAAEVDKALSFATRSGNGHAEEIIRAYRGLIQVLRGTAVESAADTAPGQPLLAVEPIVVVHVQVIRALAAAILDHPADLTRYTAAIMPILPGIESLHMTATARLLRALALAGEARAAGGSSAKSHWRSSTV
ncbi:serine/threonine protein kinase [Parafrankia sp. EUN1f]|nr:serine/threonine protein kinase [Parafrankia sp. EUN1f]